MAAAHQQKAARQVAGRQPKHNSTAALQQFREINLRVGHGVGEAAELAEYQGQVAVREGACEHPQDAQVPRAQASDVVARPGDAVHAGHVG